MMSVTISKTIKNKTEEYLSLTDYEFDFLEQIHAEKTNENSR